MRLLICGSRDYRDRKRIRDYLIEIKPDVVIEGGATGADRIAYDEARKLGIKVESFRSDWRRYGKGAGMIRNKAMLQFGNPDFCLAFFSGKVTKGTMHMVTLCKAARVRGRTIGLTKEQAGLAPLTLDLINKEWREYQGLKDLGIWESFKAYRDDPDVHASISIHIQRENLRESEK